MLNSCLCFSLKLDFVLLIRLFYLYDKEKLNRLFNNTVVNASLYLCVLHKEQLHTSTRSA